MKKEITLTATKQQIIDALDHAKLHGSRMDPVNPCAICAIGVKAFGLDMYELLRLNRATPFSKQEWDEPDCAEEAFEETGDVLAAIENKWEYETAYSGNSFNKALQNTKDFADRILTADEYQIIVSR